MGFFRANNGFQCTGFESIMGLNPIPSICVPHVDVKKNGHGGIYTLSASGIRTLGNFPCVSEAQRK
ncbi:MAG: hypothetical protein JRN20_09015 [Nitrososphaerota archaeon]|nr:hypothetical protein [Nitrososphaerota archaeon]